MTRIITNPEVATALESLRRRHAATLNDELFDGGGVDFVTAEGEPGCIVGQLLSALALPLPEAGAHEDTGSLLIWERDEHGVSFQDEGALRTLQVLADDGATWGDAIGQVLPTLHQ